MRAFLAIVFGLSIALGFSQKKKSSFQKREFEGVTLSDSWIIVKFKDESLAKLPPKAKLFSKRAPNATVQRAGVQQQSSKGSILNGIVKIPVGKGQDPLAVCNQFLKDPNVLYADPIILDQPLESVSDPLSTSQYHLENISAFEAWEVTTGDDDITIGIIDTGIDLDHEDLVDKIWINEDDPIDGVDNDENGYIDDYYGYDFADEDNDPDTDASVHGPRVAGIAGASTDNGIGIAGIGYNTKIAALKGFRSSTGKSGGLFEAILYAADNGIQILNLSWGSIRRPLQSEQDIIDYAVLEKDVVIVAAAGNEGGKDTEQSKFYPASYEHVLSVAGSNANDEKWAGSTYNFQVDITAPGAAIVSTSTGDGYNTGGGFGTSFAAPMVAAAAALVKDQFPSLSALQVMERVRSTADDIYGIGSNSLYDGKLGKGRLNIYNAVTQQSVKSVRAESPELVSSNGAYTFYGDTVMATFQLTNFLTQVNNPSVFISSANEEFVVSQGSFFPGTMGTLDEEEISFEVVLSEDLEPESTVGIRLDITDGSYVDFQYLDVTTSPDYIDFGNENISLTVEGNGGLGVSSNIDGAGLIYKGDTILHFSGIMLATDETSVSDNIISNLETSAEERDFAVDQYYKLYHHPHASFFGYSEFLDEAHGIKVEQSSITEENENFIIIRYRLINTSDTQISDLSFGLYSDWDLGQYFENYAAYNTTEDYLYTRTNTFDLFAGTKILGLGTPSFSALDIDSQNGNEADVSGSFSDQQKFDFLVSESLESAGSIGPGNDVAALHGITIDSIAPYGTHYLNVIYGVGESPAALETAFASAEAYLEEVITNPRVLEVFYTCDGANVILDPSTGDNYEFYQDALGSVLLATDSAYATGTITQDTSFFVRNIDENYPSDFVEVRVQLLNDFAAFDVLEDTLYLENSHVTINFTDQSINASSWSWDFGQGTLSTIQNPVLALNQVGTYTVTLTVENKQGCSDSFSKNIVIASRPSALAFDEYQICPGETVEISNPAASLLKVFSSVDQITPSQEGPTLELGPFNSDTTLYVTGIIDGFETEKSSLQISTIKVEADFTFSADTSSVVHQINLVSEAAVKASLLWNVNGEDLGSAPNITVSTEEPEIVASLQVTSPEGCIVTIDKSFTVSTSPTPVIADVQGCRGDTVVLSPSNGEIFGFYSDAELSSLIKKGTQLMVSKASKIYVVGLDDGLPGNVVEVDLSFADFNPAIEYESSQLGDKNKVELSVQSDQEIANYKWFVDNELVANSADPILFFDNVIVNIVTEVSSIQGCINSDSLELDFSPPPPLSALENTEFGVYPNPTTDLLNIYGSGIVGVNLNDVSGKFIKVLEFEQGPINLKELRAGIYLLEVSWADGNQSKFKIIKE